MASAIEWTDVTWNPVTGCTRVSPGCDHCYMYAQYPRLRGMGVPGYSGGPEVIDLRYNRIGEPLGWRKPRRVFVNSMSDLFHPAVPYDFIDLVWSMMTLTAVSRGHIYQVLTKRPGRAVAWWQQYRDRRSFAREIPNGWAANIWMGVSVESQKYAPRLTVLNRLPAPVRFVSAEPLLEPLDLSRWIAEGGLQWLIVGGESGPGARPMELDWARSLRDQAGRGGIPFFLKQLGGVRNKRGGPAAVLDGQTWQEMPE